MANYRILSVLSLLASQTHAKDFWIEPPEEQTDLTQTFPANVPLEIQWSGQPALTDIDPTMWNSTTTDTVLFDLYVTSWDGKSDFTSLIASSFSTSRKFSTVTNRRIGDVNLTNAGSVRWDVSIPQDQLAIDQDWVLRFFAGPGFHTGFPSRGFLVQGSSVVTTSTSSSATSSATFSNTPTIAPPQMSGSSGLSTGAKAAVGVVIPVVILASTLR